jgi:hypothetical protein
MSRRAAKSHVCFTPESGHVRCNSGCPLRANSGHAPGLIELMVLRPTQEIIGRSLQEAAYLASFSFSKTSLPLRKIPERGQELADVILRGH